MRIIPAIDLIDGKCVRLTQGDYAQQKTYNENPLEVAKAFEDAGIKHLHLVDLDGAKAGNIVNWKVLEKLASQTTLTIDFGGGLKSDNDLRIAFECGAKQVTGGSIAAKNPEVFLQWLNAYGADKIILGADAQNGKIATNGWQETTSLEVIEFIDQYVQKGIQYSICTDISKDGMLAGPSFDLYQEIMDNTPGVKLIASGGVSSIEDLEQLAEAGLEGAIVGKAFYEGKISLKALSQLC
tara:strand:- start:159 stop:875 length:717 start_codon:yes stop_codon:yes gene_type:complete